MSSPTFSVVMPLYNKEKDVARAVKSVLGQSVRDWELVVVNDGSEDVGPRIVESFKDLRIRMVSQANAGVSAARNRGIGTARSDLIAFLDADDEWCPEFLASISNLRASYPQCAVFATAYQFRGRGQVSRPAAIVGLPRGFRRGVLDNYFHVASRSDPPLWTSAVAVRATSIREIGGFPPGIDLGEDLLTWAKLALRYPIAYALEPLATYWKPVVGEKRRPPAMPDRVGSELAAMLERAGPGAPPGMREYVALWHRMRGATFLEFADSPSARGELSRAAVLGGGNARVLALLAMSMLPGGSARSAYRALKHGTERLLTG